MPTPFKRSSATSGSFLPSDYVDRKHAGRTSLIGVSLFLVVMVGVVGAFLVTNRRWNDIREQQDQINVLYSQEAQKIEQLKKLEAQRSRMLDKAEVTAALIEKVPRSILLAELITRMPKDVTLLELELKGKRIDTTPKPQIPGMQDAASKVKSLTGAVTTSKDKPSDADRVRPPKFEFTLVIGGVATANNDIAEYLGQLQACPLLANVELQYIKEAIINEIGFRRFEVLAALRPNADAHDLAGTSALIVPSLDGNKVEKTTVPAEAGRTTGVDQKREE